MALLYHYTSTYHLQKILESGYLKLTESNLRFKEEMYKPCVWLTNSASPEGHGLEGSILNKKAVRIVINMSTKHKKWKKWSRKNNINDQWADILEKNRNANSWYICESTIPVEDFVRIENVE